MNSWVSHVLFVLVVGGLAAYLLARLLMSRGFPLLGLGAGLLLLAAIVERGVSQQTLTTRLAFSRSDPCGRPPDGGMDFRPAGWWLYGAVALALYLFFTLRAMTPVLASAPASRSRSQKRWMAIILVICGAAVIAGIARHEQGTSQRNQLERLERTELLTEMGQVRDVITTGQLRELGSTPLSASQSSRAEEFPYVEPGGLRFSDDGRWLSLQYPGAVELWRVADLQVRRTVEGKASAGSLVAFSPDGSLWAVWVNDQVSVYALGDEVSEPVWQAAQRGPVWRSQALRYSPGSMAFSADSRELILSVPEGAVSLDAGTGEVTAGEAGLRPRVFGGFVLSRQGDYLAACDTEVVQVYERRSGELVNQFEFPPELHPVAMDAERAAETSFVGDDRLLLWNARDRDSRAGLWNRDTGAWSWITLGAIDRGLSCGVLALAPDSRLAVIGNWDLWDLTTQSKVGSLPIDYRTVAVTAGAFSPDQRLLAVATADGRLRFFAAD